MLITAGLFLSGVFPILWERAPAWRRQDDATFRADFAHTLRRVDRLQPALLIGCVVASSGFAVTTMGASRFLAAVAAASMLAILIGYGVRLVPIQSRLTDPAADLSADDTDELRTRWLAGHLMRTVLAILAFVSLVVAASV